MQRQKKADTAADGNQGDAFLEDSPKPNKRGGFYFVLVICFVGLLVAAYFFQNSNANDNANLRQEIPSFDFKGFNLQPGKDSSPPVSASSSLSAEQVQQVLNQKSDHVETVLRRLRNVAKLSAPMVSSNEKGCNGKYLRLYGPGAGEFSNHMLTLAHGLAVADSLSEFLSFSQTGKVSPLPVYGSDMRTLVLADSIGDKAQKSKKKAQPQVTPAPAKNSRYTLLVPSYIANELNPFTLDTLRALYCVQFLNDGGRDDAETREFAERHARRKAQFQTNANAGGAAQFLPGSVRNVALRASQGAVNLASNNNSIPRIATPALRGGDIFISASNLFYWGKAVDTTVEKEERALKAVMGDFQQKARRMLASHRKGAGSGAHKGGGAAAAPVRSSVAKSLHKAPLSKRGSKGVSKVSAAGKGKKDAHEEEEDDDDDDEDDDNKGGKKKTGKDTKKKTSESSADDDSEIDPKKSEGAGASQPNKKTSAGKSSKAKVEAEEDDDDSDDDSTDDTFGEDERPERYWEYADAAASATAGRKSQAGNYKKGADFIFVVQSDRVSVLHETSISDGQMQTQKSSLKMSPVLRLLDPGHFSRYTIGTLAALWGDIVPQYRGFASFVSKTFFGSDKFAYSAVHKRGFEGTCDAEFKRKTHLERDFAPIMSSLSKSHLGDVDSKTTNYRHPLCSMQPDWVLKLAKRKVKSNVYVASDSQGVDTAWATQAGPNKAVVGRSLQPMCSQAGLELDVLDIFMSVLGSGVFVGNPRSTFSLQIDVLRKMLGTHPSLPLALDFDIYFNINVQNGWKSKVMNGDELKMNKFGSVPDRTWTTRRIMYHVLREITGEYF